MSPGTRDGVFGILVPKTPAISRFLFFREIFGKISLFEFLAKKFVKQKLFCNNFALLARAVSRCTFVPPQTPPLLFGQNGFLAKKGRLGLGLLSFSVGLGPTAFLTFGQKVGVGAGNFLTFFLSVIFWPKKGPIEGVCFSSAPFFWPLFGAKNPPAAAFFGEKRAIFGQKPRLSETSVFSRGKSLGETGF